MKIFFSFFLSLVLLPWTATAQLSRVPNTSLNFPTTMPTEATGYTSENAFGSLTFDAPICIRYAPGQSTHLFVVQRNNGIERVNLANNTRTTFLNLASHLSTTQNPQRRLQTGGENGILSMAFHPKYKQNGFFYLFYSLNITNASNQNAQLYQRVSRFQANGTAGSYDLATTANPASELPMITQRDENHWHNGGDMHFGNDGYLYISTGDEGPGADVSDNGRFIDKDFFSMILRIDVDQKAGSLAPNAHTNTHALTAPVNVSSAVHLGTYAIPPNNPYIGITSYHGRSVISSKVRTEGWASGFRNPWRMSIDSTTGRLFVADVGQGQREEVNLITAGNNYGWSYREGDVAYTNGPGGATPPQGFNPTAPIHTYQRAQGKSVTGGVIYRGASLAEFAGRYIFGDYIDGRVWALTENTSTGAWTSQELFQESGNNIAAFGTDPRNGDVLYCMITDGVIKRLVRATGSGTPLPALLSQTGTFSNLTNLTPNAGIVGYNINQTFWSDRAEKRRWFSIPSSSATMQWAQDANFHFPNGQVWIKHFDIETEPGNPATKRKLETRFLVKNSTGAYAFTYRWRADQSDAELVANNGFTEQLSATKTWTYPSRASCMTCHTQAAGYALSFNTRQLNLDNTFSGQTQNQLQALSQAGYFSNSLPTISTLPRFPSINETSVSLEERVRAYLAINCSNCHQPGGGGGSDVDLRAHITTQNTGMINGALSNQNGDAANRFIAPNDANHSMALIRMQGGDGLTRMPPLGNRETDTAGVALVQAWIEGMSVPDTTPPTITALIPVDNQVGMASGANLVITFSEPIAIGTGNITIKNLSDSINTNIAVTSTQVTASGNLITINPSADLLSGKNYAIRIAATAIDDLAGNNFAGIANDTTWNFSTAPSPPAEVAGLALWLDAAKITGLSDGAALNTWNEMSGLTNHATRSTGAPTYETNEFNGQPVVRFPVGNGASFTFPRMTNIRTVFWVMKQTNPSEMRFLLGDTTNFHFHRGTGTPATIWSSVHASANIRNGTTSLNGLSVNGTTTPLPDGWNLLSVTTTDLVTASTISRDRTFNRTWEGDIAEILVYNRALSAVESEQVGGYLAAKYGMTTTYGAPVISTLSPADNATSVAVGADFVATFSEPIAKGIGNITIRNLTDGTATNIAVTDAQMTVTGATLMINPTADLLAGKNYAVQIATTAVKDLADSNFVGITDETTWNFTTITPYANWIGGNFGSAFTDNAPTRDPDGDGMTNQEEFAFGLNPVSASSCNPITQQLDKASNTFKYTRTKNSGYTYKVYYSTNLSNWTPDPSAIQTPATAAGNVETVTVTLATSVPQGGKLFVRVEAAP